VWVSWLSLKTKVDCLLVVWPQNHWDDLLVVWPQNHWDSFSRFALKTDGGFFVEPQNQGDGGFFWFGPQTGSYDLVIWASKSPRWFLVLDLETKRASICRLRHKTDIGRSVWDMRRDLEAYFTWKQVGLGFPSLSSRLAEAQRWVVHVEPSWRLRQSQVEDRRVDATGFIGPFCPPSALMRRFSEHAYKVFGEMPVRT
jgi:hypothetical protein